MFRSDKNVQESNDEDVLLFMLSRRVSITVLIIVFSAWENLYIFPVVKGILVLIHRRRDRQKIFLNNFLFKFFCLMPTESSSVSPRNSFVLNGRRES